MEKRSRLKIEYRPRMGVWVGRIQYWDAQAGRYARTKVTSLGTDDPVLAQSRYDAWLATGELPLSSAGEERFAAAAERLTLEKAKLGKDMDDRLHRLREYAFPIIGHLRVMDLSSEHVASVLDAMMRRGLSAAYQLKMRSDLSRICAALARTGAMRVNVARGVELHEDAEDDARERVVLSPEHEAEFRRQRGTESEFDMLYLHCRELHGGRTSCLHASRWEDWDLVTFSSVRVRRPKTDADARGRTSEGRRRRERGATSWSRTESRASSCGRRRGRGGRRRAVPGRAPSSR